MNHMKQYKRALTIAGSDSSGGAGIQADLKTFSALGCYGMTVITAVTAQNTQGVSGVWPMDGECVKRQLSAVLSDIGADAVKIGMLWSAELASDVVRILKTFNMDHVVFDPVMVAQSGDSLFEKGSPGDLVSALAPAVTIMTPNLNEAAYILGYSIQDLAGMENAARDLSSIGFSNILVKGGHLSGESSVDVLYLSETGDLIHFVEKRVETQNNHGTGCTLSSAIAAFLAHGKDLVESCRLAKNYITQALVHGSKYKTGKGYGPVHHFHGIWE